jgi:hypothetical protein
VSGDTVSAAAPRTGRDRHIPDEVRAIASRAVSDDERQAFAVPFAEGEYDDIELSLLDRDDEDDRRLLIQAEHPEFHRALASGQREVHVGGVTVNPVLHIAMHEIVANQVWANEPPEMWQTVVRLLDAGYERHEVLHMLASVVSGEVFEALRDQTPHEIERVRAALAELPGSWERQRAAIPEERHMNRSERRAAARKRPH